MFITGCVALFFSVRASQHYTFVFSKFCNGNIEVLLDHVYAQILIHFRLLNNKIIECMIDEAIQILGCKWSEYLLFLQL